jgi:uncharacterized protein
LKPLKAKNEVHRINMKSSPLPEILERLKKEFELEKVILFGSQSSQSGHEDSDYDLIVVVKNSSENMLERCQRASRVLRGVGVPVDVLVVTRTEFLQKSQDPDSIYSIASSTGQELSLG